MKTRLSAQKRAFLTAIGAFILISGTGFAGALSLFYLPVTSELGFSQAGFAAYMTIMSLGGIISHPVEGRLAVRYEKAIRLIIFAGAVLGLAVFSLWSVSRSLILFYIGGAMMSFVMPIVSAQVAVDAVNHWFIRRRRLVVSVVTMGMSLGTVIYSQVVRLVMDWADWRGAYMAMGIVLFLLSAIGALLISPPPHTIGMKPYGWEERSGEGAALHGMSLPEALRTRGFWLFCLAAVLGCINVMGLTQSLAPLFQVDYGLSAAFAATLISIYSAVCALSKPLFGMIYEKGGLPVAIGYVALLMSAAQIFICFAGGAAAAVVAMVVLGMGNMFASVIISNFTADAFGNRAYAAIFGYVNIFFTLGAAGGPVLVGFIADQLGSYRPAYLVFTALCLCSCALTYAAYRSLRKTPQKTPRKDGITP